MAKPDTLAPAGGTVAAGALGGPLPTGKTFLPGVYTATTTMNLAAGNLAILDAVGDPNAVFIFKVGTALTDAGILANPSEIRLVNGAHARNVWFVVNGAATLGTGTKWNGNILAGGTIVLSGGSTVNGRLLAGAAGAGAFTMTSTPPLESPIIITVPQ